MSLKNLDFFAKLKLVLQNSSQRLDITQSEDVSHFQHVSKNHMICRISTKSSSVEASGPK